jgi:hypothetical protein
MLLCQQNYCFPFISVSLFWVFPLYKLPLFEALFSKVCHIYSEGFVYWFNAFMVSKQGSGPNLVPMVAYSY